MAKVVHFEIHAEDPERAIRFYETVLGWRFQKMAPPHEYWLIETGPADEPGINGGLIRRRGTVDGTAVIAYVCTVKVHSVDEVLEKVQKASGHLAAPKMAIPGSGWLLYCKDTEGNVFGLTHDDPAAM
jgi:hypothetical protein